MEILHIIIYIFELVLFIYLGFSAAYIFIFALASIFPYQQKAAKSTKKRKFAVLIPGYKEDAVIVDVAKDALNQDYPKDQYDLVIIADSFQAQTIESLKELPVKLVEVSFEVSTKSKALNKAMQTIGDNYDVALVLDADNLMEKNFIQKVNQSFDNGYMVVQGHRAAKNLNTSFAILDAISEEVNNNIFRKGHRVLGFSSALIGSGMAFDYSFFKETMSKVNAIGGFDKELELKLLKNKKKIEYLDDAIVLDEKVQKSEVFARQRKRWLSAQFIYFARYFFPGLYHLLFKGNVDFFDKVYQMISPPRILLLGLVVIFNAFYLVIWYFFESLSILHFTIQEWMYVLILVLLAFAISIPQKFYTRRTLRAILTLPRAFFLMFASLFKLKGANKKFIHTEHGVNN
ncbi:glycosyltransferase [Marinifilum sp.]|uniref:glycosyltransferase n=1 Tax=Marinifilum sp. TaxID=2033137 RepID=UPI003BA96DF1